MIQTGKKHWRSEDAPREAVPEVDLASTIRAARAGLRRQWRLIAGLTLALTALAMVYAYFAKPTYTARAEVVVDPRISNSPSGPEAPTLLLSDALVVDSELKVLSSREVTMRSAEDMGLFDPSTEAAEEPGPLSALLDMLRAALSPRSEKPVLDAEDAEASRREIIRRKMMEDFDISRDGGTYVISIAFTSPDPVFAMKAVNTLIDAYFDVSSDAALSDTRRIASWLDQSVEKLADEVQAADRAVADYRRENNLFTMRDSVLPSEAELSSATDRLISLRSQLIEIENRQDKIEGIVDSGSAGALMDGTLGGEVASPALRDFQTRYARLISEQHELVRRWGSSSDLVARNQQDQQQLREVILDEARQIAGRMNTQIEAVRREITATEAQVEELRARASADAEKSIRLRELERDAEAKRSQYGSMLQQMISAAQRESFQRAPARVIARAVPPDQVASPKTKRLLVLTVFAGLVLGTGIAFLREMTDDRLRRVTELRDGLGLRAFGLVPGVSAARKPVSKPGSFLMPPPATNSAARGSLRSIIAQMQRIHPENGALISGLAAASRSSGVAQLSGWLASSVAGSGERVLVLDLTGDAAALAALTPAGTAPQYLDIGAPPLDELARLQATARPGQPLVAGLPKGTDILAATQQRNLEACLGALRPQLDLILLILPELAERPEVEIAAGFADCSLLVLRWGEASVNEVTELLGSSSTLAPRLFGAVFTAETSRGFSRYNA
ncbi:GumC family protein [Paracoccus lutimaris]|uniref:Uncharacterized protein involved in exopolysaccharide biosynthesis n=1 Tax=Paracoccus lutimaris TaxID=1490030 RepID=A0A368YHE0_9RHOB|nr:exopolysaccharide transport family protein [Paracoccus lutimaris]RCW79650.1 uncharacterized protein involved in exopolysaccharide biosynthesis [Paracoccus lutimaris]